MLRAFGISGLSSSSSSRISGRYWYVDFGSRKALVWAGCLEGETGASSSECEDRDNLSPLRFDRNGQQLIFISMDSVGHLVKRTESIEEKSKRGLKEFNAPQD
jgi:hypothetical protein